MHVARADRPNQTPPAFQPNGEHQKQHAAGAGFAECAKAGFRFRMRSIRDQQQGCGKQRLDLRPDTPCFWHLARFPASQSKPANVSAIPQCYTNVYTNASLGREPLARYIRQRKPPRPRRQDARVASSHSEQNGSFCSSPRENTVAERQPRIGSAGSCRPNC